MTSTIEARVAKGAAWLDHVRPGWRDEVTPAALDMRDGCKCIAGQVFAGVAGIGFGDGYGYALFVYGTDEPLWDAAHGFAAIGEDEEEWRALEREWYRVLGVPTNSLLVTHV